MSGRDRDSRMDSGEHFVGEYAGESTPHWTDQYRQVRPGGPGLSRFMPVAERRPAHVE